MCLLNSCSEIEDIKLDIIPLPVNIKSYAGSFTFNSDSKIYYNFDDEHTANVLTPLYEHLSDYYGIEKPESGFSGRSRSNSIFLRLNTKSDLPEEGYKLIVQRNKIILESSSQAGLFYGVHSLIQMMPAEKERKESFDIQRVEITDYPRFSWRGLHLDVCRHFMPKEFVLRYIDLMAIHKFNKFHFHLTEDQGWRIEIKKYPLLTEIGSQRKETLIGRARRSTEYDGTPHGGYYTQDDIREIVEYAAARYITVVPEIEMPGHALAALASYPHLGCTGGPYEVATTWGVFHDVMCAGKESTFEFLQDVLDEVLDLFPSAHIHIGGDECPKTQWKECPLCQQRIKDENLADEYELQSYFIKRIENYLTSKGRTLVGWDEILEGGLAPNAVVMSWRGEQGGIEAARQSHYVVMTPGSHCYFDHYQADPETQPLAIGGFTPLDKVYHYEPVPEELSKEEARFVLGAQGNVWTEYMKSEDHIEYMVYPRAAALAEVVWSPRDIKDYDDFMRRLLVLLKRYDNLGLNYSRVAFESE